MSEHRVHPRIRSLLTGRIEFNHRQSTIDCVIREMSAGGAKLDLPHSAAIPDEFDLRVLHKEQVFRAKVRWRAGNSIGVEFEQTKTAAIAPPIAEALRKLEAENVRLRLEIEALKSGAKTDRA